ncbi:MAG: hypothetical protein ACI82G_002932, partial [Bradymonadia bacterium]
TKNTCEQLGHRMFAPAAGSFPSGMFPAAPQEEHVVFMFSRS